MVITVLYTTLTFLPTASELSALVLLKNLPISSGDLFLVSGRQNTMKMEHNKDETQPRWNTREDKYETR